MNITDSKQISTILSSYDIIKYLSIWDRVELSSTSKLIYDKLTCYRLERYNIGSSEFQEYINNTQQRTYWTDDNYEPRLEYFNDAINKYKPYLTRFAFGVVDYILLNHFSFKFQNLTSLELSNIILPKSELLVIIGNFKKLSYLTLMGITAAYSKTENINTKFKFSAFLRQLKWQNCVEFELNDTDLLSSNQLAKYINFENTKVLDISLNLVNSLKSLIWCNFDSSDMELLCNLITNNPGLTKFTTTLHSINQAILECITNNRNLTELTILDSISSILLTSDHLINLANIKSLHFPFIASESVTSINLLIERCQNLENLELFLNYNTDITYTNYIKKLVKLKALKVISTVFIPSFLYSNFSQDNLEVLEICTFNPLKLNFNNFTNLTKLKVITNACSDNNPKNWTYSPDFEDLNGWRAIKYDRSIKYWKL
ncbi:hypothetical protein CONCODRAFT_70210 [Conidiobolus coronatus NRRL 28638]|uniref:RNI-like protein n=1 Tax=Conidiobolus coronatus (strain ATCC 28846 / CBS 209.66 / NRRL 28638) TaxID=796925 RepID=A0A137P7H5_CONC2|nr:hypothetical protein CONCODRAFT_70210 [Conidiobolus coronatus NRRL 28638]|eukprot:KXN70963.1 hypothetical protein CONCODRAFT_70210 [Conidiobolus coronatus NRRL 28638]